MADLTALAPRRIGLIDELRGFFILLMVAYHALYDIVFLFGVNVPAYGFITDYVQPIIAGAFILMSGISCRYSRSNLKRGVRVLLLAMVLTAVTVIFMPEQSIYFGILHFMGTAMLLFVPLKPVLDKIPPVLGMICFGVMFLFTYRLPYGWLGFWGFLRIPLPAALYQIRYLLPIGFGGMGADYFPLLPWLFLFLFGSCLGMLFLKGAFPDWAYRGHCKFLSAAGRRTIVIYMLHQPVIYGLLTALFWVLEKLGVSW